MKKTRTFLIRDNPRSPRSIPVPTVAGNKDVSPRIAQIDADQGKMRQRADWYSIGVHSCDPRLMFDRENVAALPAIASIRVMRGPYTWSIPVRLFEAVERARR